MIEIKIVLDDIDYNSLANAVLPIATDNFVKSDNFFAKIVKHIPQNAINSASNTILNSLPQKMKNKFAASITNHFKKNILEAIQKTADEYGVKATIKSLTVTNSEE